MPRAGCGCQRKHKEGQKEAVTEAGPLSPRSGKLSTGLREAEY